MSEDIKIDNSWPKSTRLNHENRDLFIRTVVEDLIPSDSEPTDRNFGEQWGPRVYGDVYGPHLETMKLLPAWMFMKNTEFEVDLFMHEPQGSKWKDKDGIVTMYLPKEELMINEETVYHWNRKPNAVQAQVDPGHDAIQAYKDILESREDWHSKRKELQETVREVAYACNTSHQLFRAWPKAVEYGEKCFPYVEPKEIKRGGQTSVSAAQLDLTAKLAQTTVIAPEQN